MKALEKLFLVCIFLIVFSIGVYAQVPINTYLNDSTQYSSSGNTTLSFSSNGKDVNLSLETNPVHMFEAQAFSNTDNYVIEYPSSNSSSEYLLKLLIDDEGASGNTANDRILLYDCTSNTNNVLCQDVNCGSADFGKLSNFTINFHSNNTFSIFVSNTSNPKPIAGTLCANAAGLSGVRISPDLATLQRYKIKNNLVTASNRAPVFIGNIPNITLPEDTSSSINLSGNFSDLDNQNLTFGFSGLQNITITINQSSGTANITPQLNFNGMRNVTFFANDS